MASRLRSTMAASGSWFGPRLCRKGRYAALRRGTKPINPGARRLLGWGWVLTANGVPHRPRDSVAWSGGIELGAVVPLRGTSEGCVPRFKACGMWPVARVHDFGLPPKVANSSPELRARRIWTELRTTDAKLRRFCDRPPYRECGVL